MATPTKSFVVIEFVGESASGKKQIELVPRSWLNDDEPRTCYYPPASEYDKIDNMVRNKMPPDTTWETFLVKTLKFTTTYERGEKKLCDAFQKVLSSDSGESEVEMDNLSELSRSQVKKILQQSKHLQKLPTIIENEGRTDSGMEHEEIQESAATSASDAAGSVGIKQPVGKVTSRKEKKRIIETELKQMQEKSHKSETTLLMNYITATMELTSLNIMEKLDAMRRGWQYDFHKQTDDLKETTFMACTPNTSTVPINPKTKLNTEFPINNYEEFLKFDKSLNPKDESNAENPKEAVERQEALKDLMKMEAGGIKNYEDAVPIILTAIMTPDVQGKYSSIGRKTIHGGKENFSATFTFKCLEDYLKVTYNLNNKEPKELKILSRVGKFLWTVDDRNGVAAAKKKEALLRRVLATEPN